MTEDRPNRWSKIRCMFKAFVRYKQSETAKSRPNATKSPSLLSRVSEISSATLKRKSPWRILSRLGSGSNRGSFESASSSGIPDEMPGFDDISLSFSAGESNSGFYTVNSREFIDKSQPVRSHSERNQSERCQSSRFQIAQGHQKRHVIQSQYSVESSKSTSTTHSSSTGVSCSTGLSSSSGVNRTTKLSKSSTIKSSDTITKHRIDIIEPWIPVLYIARLKLQCGGTKAIDLFEQWPIDARD